MRLVWIPLNRARFREVKRIQLAEKLPRPPDKHNFSPSEITSYTMRRWKDLQFWFGRLECGPLDLYSRHSPFWLSPKFGTAMEAERLGTGERDSNSQSKPPNGSSDCLFFQKFSRSWRTCQVSYTSFLLKTIIEI